MIELLIVIALIGILSGVLLTVINPDSQKAIAKDGVRSGTLSSLANTLNVYYASEGVLLTDTNGNGNVLDDNTTTLGKYLNSWPHDNDLSGIDDYYYVLDTPNNDFCVSVKMGTKDAYFKFTNAGSKVHKDCTSGCSVTKVIGVACIPLD